jgi:ElaA protein
VEQDCVYLDIDGMDQGSLHVYIKDKETILAYVRIYKTDTMHIGRVVVNPDYRKQGLGKKIMAKAIDYITNTLQETTITISAQEYLLRFYQELGFKESGNPYLEDGIPHIKMIYKT